jgi:hypothetical protein
LLYNTLESLPPTLVVLDRGFRNWTNFPKNITKLIPPFLSQQNNLEKQFTPEEVTACHNIGSLRSIVERVNKSLKENKILSHIRNTMLDDLDEHMLIAMAITNFPFYHK